MLESNGEVTATEEGEENQEAQVSQGAEAINAVDRDSGTKEPEEISRENGEAVAKSEEEKKNE